MPLTQPLEVTGTSNFGKFIISYGLIDAPNFIKIGDGAVQFCIFVADFTWNDPKAGNPVSYLTGYLLNQNLVSGQLQICKKTGYLVHPYFKSNVKKFLFISQFIFSLKSISFSQMFGNVRNARIRNEGIS